MIRRKVSLITTVYNEEENIVKLVDSVLAQSVLPSEFIIVDGGSRDKTSQIVKEKIKQYRKKIKIIFLEKKGNRSVGRNEAIINAISNIILITDSGCVLGRNWIKNISAPFKNPKIDVVAGYYKGLNQTVFQKCLIPYVLVTEDKVDAKTFLPATRSMALKKSIWKKCGGFDEKLSHNEDYAFANRLKKIKARIAFEENAVAYWIPRANLKDAFVMFFRFAFGDAEGGIIREKVFFIFARYLFYLYLVFLFTLMKSSFLLFFAILLPILYVLWSIKKNYKYVDNTKALFYLPLLQIVSDCAVLGGTTIGSFKLVKFKRIFKYVKNNKIIFFMALLYSLTVLSSIKWGIPGKDHPFTYHMDEWHQLQAVRDVFKYGSPNLPGSANGSMFHFFYSGLILIPFIILNVVNPFFIKFAVDSMSIQEKLFMIMRLNTLFFGLFSIFVFAKIIKYLRLNILLCLSLFIFTPAWLMLSNYFKYDIALAFWITLSLLGIIKYSESPKFSSYLLAGIPVALAVSVKISAFPIVLVYFSSFFIFNQKITKNLSTLMSGALLNFFIFIFFGIPDIVFGGKNMNEYLYSNLVTSPSSFKNILFGQNYWLFIFTEHFPTIFGHAFILMFIISFIVLIINLIANFNKKSIYFYRLKFLILLSFLLFFISFILIKFFVGANRGLVLIPFMVLMIGFSVTILLEKSSHIFRKCLLFFIILLLIIQVSESYMWIILKHSISPQEDSSLWIEKNIPKNSTIGIENIPLYQFEPDIILKEFYNKVHDPKYKTKYKYSVISYKNSKIPPVIVITNAKLELVYLSSSQKKLLLKRIIKDGYKESYVSMPKFPFYLFFGNDLNYMHSGLLAYPSSISIFEKK